MASLRDAEVTEVYNNTVERTLIEDGNLHVHRTYHDDVALERNKQIRNASLLDRAKLNLHEGEDIRGVLSVPSLGQWNRYCRDNPGTYQNLLSTHEHERMAALRSIHADHPEWFVQTRL